MIQLCIYSVLNVYVELFIMLANSFDEIDHQSFEVDILDSSDIYDNEDERSIIHIFIQI